VLVQDDGMAGGEGDLARLREEEEARLHSAARP
jgi:hypothetical protein